VTHRGAAALAVAAVLTMGACGTTYVDTSITVPNTGDTTATTLPPLAADTPLPTLLGDLEQLMRHFDEQIVDQDDVPETMARIEQVWDVAEAQIRDRDPDDLFPFEQAIGLARTAAERRRPADASKGYKVLIAAIDAYPAAAR
jgi:hypothetical protein